MREADALQAECERAEETLRAVPGDAWTRPGLGEWTVHQLCVHLTRGVGRLSVYLDQPVEGPAVKDRVTYFQYDPDAAAPGIAARIAKESAALPPEQVAREFAEVWRDSVAKARAAAADRVMTTIFGPMHVQEYTATRVLEMVVHHMDLRRALDLSPDPDPDAADLVVGILEGLLDGPRPRNLGRDRFILVCTGRIAHDDPRFPVLR
jgi:uncharacterized protein (TIGR03083 family)